MKTNIGRLAIALTVLTCTSAFAGRITIAPSQSPITRHAGESIPLSFSARGFPSGQTAEIWLISARSWVGDIIDIGVPVDNGPNTLEVKIPWSFWDVGPYILQIRAGSVRCSDTRIVSIRSAVLWPYPRITYPKGGAVSVSWTVPLGPFGPEIAADYLDIWLYDEDAQQLYLLAEFVDPAEGQHQIVLPPDVAGPHMRIQIDGYLSIMDPFWEDGYEPWPDLSETARSGQISIR